MAARTPTPHHPHTHIRARAPSPTNLPPTVVKHKCKPGQHEPSPRPNPPHPSPTLSRPLPNQSPPLRMVPTGPGLVRVVTLGLHILLRKPDIQGQRGHLERVSDQTLYGQRGGTHDTVTLGAPRCGGRGGQQFGEQDWEFEFGRVWREKRFWDSRPGSGPRSDEREGCLRGLPEEHGAFGSGVHSWRGHGDGERFAQVGPAFPAGLLQ
jgi:hypothetical protein